MTPEHTTSPLSEGGSGTVTDSPQGTNSVVLANCLIIGGCLLFMGAILAPWATVNIDSGYRNANSTIYLGESFWFCTDGFMTAGILLLYRGLRLIINKFQIFLPFFRYLDQFVYLTGGILILVFTVLYREEARYRYGIYTLYHSFSDIPRIGFLLGLMGAVAAVSGGYLVKARYALHQPS